MKKKYIAKAVIARLPIYYRYLREKLDSGTVRVSSMLISAELGFSASQVRQDFSSFGEFGQQGYGYDVSFLAEQMKSLLGLNEQHTVIVVGGGKIGQALASYRAFKSEGFIVKAVFDINPSAVVADNDIEVFHVDRLSEYLSSHEIDIGIVATVKEVAASIAQQLVDNGVKAIWNFAPVIFNIDGAVIENMHMSESLFQLSYKLNILRNKDLEE